MRERGSEFTLSGLKGTGSRVLFLQPIENPPMTVVHLSTSLGELRMYWRNSMGLSCIDQLIQRQNSPSGNKTKESQRSRGTSYCFDSMDELKAKGAVSEFTAAHPWR